MAQHNKIVMIHDLDHSCRFIDDLDHGCKSSRSLRFGCAVVAVDAAAVVDATAAVAVAARSGGRLLGVVY